MRNDNPSNIILKTSTTQLDASSLKKQGNTFFKQGQHQKAINSYKSALAYMKRMAVEDTALTVTIMSNMIQCYIKLDLYEDALEFSDTVLGLDPKHKKALYRKGKALAQLGRFGESLDVFEKLELKKEIQIV